MDEIKETAGCLVFFVGLIMFCLGLSVLHEMLPLWGKLIFWGVLLMLFGYAVAEDKKEG